MRNILLIGLLVGLLMFALTVGFAGQQEPGAEIVAPQTEAVLVVPEDLLGQAPVVTLVHPNNLFCTCFYVFKGIPVIAVTNLSITTVFRYCYLYNCKLRSFKLEQGKDSYVEEEITDPEEQQWLMDRLTGLMT